MYLITFHKVRQLNKEHQILITEYTSNKYIYYI